MDTPEEKDIKKFESEGNEPLHSEDNNLWADAEYHFYGILEGITSDHQTRVIHLQTQEYGLLTIAAEDGFQPNLQDDMLNKAHGARTKVRQNFITGDLDLSTLKLLELEPYDQEYDQEYLEELINQAAQNWKDVQNVDQWLEEIRGTNGR